MSQVTRKIFNRLTFDFIFLFLSIGLDVFFVVYAPLILWIVVPIAFLIYCYAINGVLDSDWTTVPVLAATCSLILWMESPWFLYETIVEKKKKRKEADLRLVQEVMEN